MSFWNTTNRECDADHEAVMEPVIGSKALPVEGAVIQVERKTELDREPIVRIRLKVIEVSKGMYKIGTRGIDDQCIMKGVHGIVGLFILQAAYQVIEGCKEPHPKGGIDKLFEHPCLYTLFVI